MEKIKRKKRRKQNVRNNQKKAMKLTNETEEVA